MSELVPLDAEARNELAALAYNEWSQSVGCFKAVQKETDDGSQDWKLFHASRLKDASKRLERAKRVLNQIQAYSPIVLGK